MSNVISSFEDLKALEGLEVGVSDWFQITQDQINQFADVTLDHQWIHVDVERAQKAVSYTHLTLPTSDLV